jgi:hypothetical protein
MSNKKYISWIRAILDLLQKPPVKQNELVLEKDLNMLIQRLSNYHNNALILKIQDSVIIAKMPVAKRLWVFIPVVSGFESFFPDKRIQTHRLLGKSASGPSPPICKSCF